MSDTTVWTLTPAPRAAQQARRLMADWCHQNAIPPPTREDALLVTSELVTNATKHALGVEEVTISVAVKGGALRITVADDGTGQPHAGPTPTDFAMSGRGLVIIDQVTQAWGIRRTVNGKVVWCTLPIGAGPAEEHPHVGQKP